MSESIAGLIEVAPPAEVPGLVLYRGVGVRHPYPPHWHEELHLCAYTGGEGHVGYRAGSERVGAGDLLLTAPGEMHSNWVGRGASVSFRSAYLPVPLLRAAARQVTGRAADADELVEHRPRDARLRPAFLAIHAALERAATPLERDDLLVGFLRRLLLKGVRAARVERPAGVEAAAVRRAREYLDAHHADPVTLADLGRVAALSPFHLHRAFRAAVGLPPHAYLVGVRVNRARDLLRRGMPPAEVAGLTGFADQSHLTRHFHRRVGVTPARFRAPGGPSRRDDA